MNLTTTLCSTPYLWFVDYDASPLLPLRLIAASSCSTNSPAHMGGYLEARAESAKWPNGSKTASDAICPKSYIIKGEGVLVSCLGMIVEQKNDKSTRIINSPLKILSIGCGSARKLILLLQLCDQSQQLRACQLCILQQLAILSGFQYYLCKNSYQKRSKDNTSRINA